MRTGWRGWVIGGLIGLHFTMLTLGMCKVYTKNRVAFLFQDLYAHITGAGGSFGFFSPTVPRELQLQFDIETKSHEIVRGGTLKEWTVPEIRARLGNMIRLIEKNYENEKVLRSVAATFTAEVFRQHPEAATVTLHAYIYYLPTMKEYKQGQKPELKEIYAATFRPSES